MSTALCITAYNRPDYLRKTLASWSKVCGIENATVYISIDPSEYEVEREVVAVAKEFLRRNGGHYAINPVRHGVLHHPWVVFDKLFSSGFDFVIRAEDDLLVSDDTLAYFDWAEPVFRNDADVATIHAYSYDYSTDSSLVHKVPKFNPLVWGTWRDRWYGFMRDTWDHDYSTFNGQPGNQAGWDWHLNTRLYPARGLHGVYPLMSRVDNIGVHGTHSTPENFHTAPSFRSEYGCPEYRLG